MALVGSRKSGMGDYGRRLLALMGLRPPVRCPCCGSPRLVDLVYGEPDGETLEAARAGLVRLGGWPTEWEPPEQSCLDCGADTWPDGRWRKPAKPECAVLVEAGEPRGAPAPGGSRGAAGADPETAARLVTELVVVGLKDGPPEAAWQELRVPWHTPGGPLMGPGEMSGPGGRKTREGERV